jgi:hypothetical protein
MNGELRASMSYEHDLQPLDGMSFMHAAQLLLKQDEHSFKMSSHGTHDKSHVLEAIAGE